MKKWLLILVGLLILILAITGCSNSSTTTTPSIDRTITGLVTVIDNQGADSEIYFDNGVHIDVLNQSISELNFDMYYYSFNLVRTYQLHRTFPPTHTGEPMYDIIGVN
jgi:hypothetical protein